MTEYGVVWSDGHVSPGLKSAAVAERLCALWSVKGYQPVPSHVVQRDVGAWSPVVPLVGEDPK